MRSSVKTDIISGKPADMIKQEERLNKEKIEKDILKEQASKMGISRSLDAKVLLEMIENCAIKRMEKIISEDPELTAYQNMLKELGHTESLAVKAYKKLYSIKIIG
jgi:hypothetical protein